MKKCQYCGTKVEDRISKCPGCGAYSFYKECKKCGRDYEGPVCPNCEEEVWAKVDKTNFSAKPEPEERVTPAGSSPKSKLIALLLCLFLGNFGAHNFYAGRVGRGIVYLITQGVFGLGIIYDFVMILLDKYEDKDGLFFTEW